MAAKKAAKKVTKKAAKAPAAAKPKKAAAPDKPYTKSQLYATLADRTGLSKKQVTGVFDELSDIIQTSISKKGPGEVSIPGLLKIRRHQKKARPARPGTNPKTGEKIMVKAQPAKTVVKVRVMKGLKDMI